MASSISASTLGARPEPVTPQSYTDHIHANAHVVSWAAILAGAIAAAALSLILLMLGTGLGLSSISPWTHEGISKTSFGVSTIVWILVTQILAAGMGGYLAGRCRTKWTGVHTDEIYFRDTVHGFMAWALATLATVALLTSAIGAAMNGAAHAGAVAAGSATAAMAGGAAMMGTEKEQHHGALGADAGVSAYFIDSLFRSDANSTATAKPGSVDTTRITDTSAEVTRIFINAIRHDTMLPADVAYVGQLVAQRTGLAQQDAEKRVKDVFATIQEQRMEAEIAAKTAADKLRKATIYITLWLFVSFLLGAFSASLAATWGGCARDA